MVGIVIVAHFGLSEEFLSTMNRIYSEITQIEAVSIDTQENSDALRTRIKRAMKNVDSGDGILILTDMFGGTPSNISLSFLEEGKVEVLTGVNLPMLLKIYHCRDVDLLTLAHYLKHAGQEGINLASEILAKNCD
ncbi:MAG: PTS sugar transporter subunit IIA [Thermodesulfobacteriota bacterium]|nr:PTS sugar transporter subunit IIA [Thermodesulfobacteriota bacterium]